MYRRSGKLLRRRLKGIYFSGWDGGLVQYVCGLLERVVDIFKLD
jgi:hypothetical protein